MSRNKKFPVMLTDEELQYLTDVVNSLKQFYSLNSPEFSEDFLKFETKFFGALEFQ